MQFHAFNDLLTSVYITLLTFLQHTADIYQLVCEIVRECEVSHMTVGVAGFDVKAQQQAAGTMVGPNARRDSEMQKLLDMDDIGSFNDLGDLLATPQGSFVRADTQLSVLSGAASSAPTASAMQQSVFAQYISEAGDVLFGVCELCHIRAAKLISIRAEQNVLLNTTDFYRLFGATSQFLQATEALCQRMVFPLKGALLAQAKQYIAHFHEEKAKQICLLLENEQWAQQDIPIDFQQITDELQLCKSTRKQSLKDEEDVKEKETDLEVDLTSSALAPIPPTKHNVGDKHSQSKTITHLTVDGQKYYVVGTVLLFLKMLTEYVNQCQHISPLSPDILNRVFEILKVFNSRTCQVILGGGAVRSAGLKSISARHIALASQSLGVIIAIIPYVRTGISVFISPKQQMLLNDFDRIAGDYRDHQNELYLKLIGIMNDRLAVHTASLSV